MRENPYLKVLSLNGWYDMATPFFGTEYDLNHMMLEPAQQRNLQFNYYPSGHMVYLNPDALHAGPLWIDILLAWMRISIPHRSASRMSSI